MLYESHLVYVAILRAEAPRRWDIPRAEAEIGDPVRKLRGTTENDQDHFIVRRDEGLSIMDGIEQRLPRHPLISLEVRRKSGKTPPPGQRIQTWKNRLLGYTESIECLATDVKQIDRYLKHVSGNATK